MKHIIISLFACLITLSANAQNKEFTLKASIPSKSFLGKTTADFDVTVLTENGEKSLGTLHLVADKDSMLVGQFQTETDGSYCASAVWTEDPHMGFAFFLEPGTVTAAYKENGFSVHGTQLNEVYAQYKNESEAEQQNGYSRTKLNAITEKYMQKYSDTPLFSLLFQSHMTVSMASFQTDANTIAEVERLWAIGSDSAKKDKNLLETYNRICHNDIADGMSLRDVEIPNATVEDSKTVRLSDYIGHGKWVFIDFWASWCGGCRQAIPLVKKVYETVKDNDNILFISIAEWDRRSAALKAMKEENMPWLQLIDEKGACGSAYMFSTIPRFMLFAPDGTLSHKDIDRNKIKDVINTALGK